MLYSCFEANVRASDSSVFDHEMPGGQYTNLMVRVKWQMVSTLIALSIVPSFAVGSWDTVDRCVAKASDLLNSKIFAVIKQKYIEANALVSFLSAEGIFAAANQFP